MVESDILLGFIVAFFAVFLFFILIAIIFFILQAIGLFKMAKREGKGEMAWLAWIPFISQFLMTLLVERNVHEGIRGKFTLLYGIAFVSSIIFSSFIPFIGLIPFVMIIYAFYFIAEKYSDNPVLHIVIAIITLSCSIPIQIFMFRNRESRSLEEEPVIIDEEDL